MKKETKCVHSGTRLDDKVYGVNTPIYSSTAYLYPNDLELVRYPRYSNTPSQEAPAEKIADLEGGEAGSIFSSGMGAISTTLMTFLRPGDHVVFQDGLYGGTQRMIRNQLERMNVTQTFVSSSDPQDFAKAVEENTMIIYIESPTNPLMTVVDLKGIAKVGQEKGVLTIIDNTFASPINQRPLEHGFDIVVHSGTKYLNGHSDVICGAVVASRELMDKIQATAVDLGPTLDMHASYLLERGLKTLAIRVARQNENAMTISRFLEKHPKVRQVNYPGLESHPNHVVAKEQMDGFGGMMSFEIDCDDGGVNDFMRSLKLVTAAISLGGVETLVTLPAKTSHSYLSKEDRQAQGIEDSLVRMSVGIEDPQDIIDDLAQALERL